MESYLTFIKMGYNIGLHFYGRGDRPFSPCLATALSVMTCHSNENWLFKNYFYTRGPGIVQSHVSHEIAMPK